jgi:hypothetical protein
MVVICDRSVRALPVLREFAEALRDLCDDEHAPGAHPVLDA